MVDDRLADFVKSEMDNLINNNTAIISHHGTTIKLICSLLDIKRENIWRFRVKNGSIVKLNNYKDYFYMEIDG